MSELLDCIDSTFWRNDMLALQQDSNLPILVGRPLAVVRSRASISLYGGPAYNQQYQETGKSVTDGFETVQFPLRLGDLGIRINGVQGYFVDDDDNRFYPIQDQSPPNQRAAAAMPVRQVCAAGRARLSRPDTPG